MRIKVFEDCSVVSQTPLTAPHDDCVLVLLYTSKRALVVLRMRTPEDFELVQTPGTPRRLRLDPTRCWNMFGVVGLRADGGLFFGPCMPAEVEI